ncbi:calcium/sodium antiporter [Nitrogeniibacter mangrovi]|uniref:Calcium/sodium antiporter n=1 Tax=Nitrogeniibacter mangrovi TaxID=2016596 RepID=A0A6C1BA94_9RHOO|nr:calcium/sodium antiporter [Nitrogeniibacter mangrovi]QID19300.1 calcium/sodium antiporter [Nitrogeniibacter mangrovi]
MIDLLLFLVGLVALTAGAEILVRGASRLALTFGLSPLVVGLTIVAFGTSAPEIAVAIEAALNGQADLTIGNVVGSNICNILLILGLGSLVGPLVVAGQVVRQEVPVMIAASALVVLLAWNGVIGRGEGVVLFVLLVAYVVFLVRQSRRASRREQQHYGEELPKATWDQHWAVQGAMVLGGLALLVIGADWLVAAAVTFAKWLGVSDLVIGLTVVAVGTSLPEVATSVMAAWRGERDMAIGNAVGSNVFNLLGCLGLGALISPTGLPVAPAALDFDLWVMLAVAVACLPIFLARRRIARWEGLLFLVYYAAYLIYLVLDARGSGALKTFSQAMLWFVIPLSVLTLIALSVHDRRTRRR